MSRWYRAYAGMARDDKLVRVALKAKQPIERVVWIWCAILESAAELDDGGRYDIDIGEVAYFLRADEADISNILDALCDIKRVASGFVVNWGDRQFQSDRSAERQKRYRERQKQETKSSDCNASGALNVTVTSPLRHGDAPETETYTDNTPSLRSGVARARDETEPVEKQKRKPKKPMIELPEGWQPDQSGRDFAIRYGMPHGEITYQIQQFTDHHRKNATHFADWSAAWRTWCGNYRKFGGFKHVGQTGQRPDPRANSISAAARRLSDRLDAAGQPAGGGETDFGVVRLLPMG